MGGRNAWVDGRVDVLLAALHELGLSVSRAAAADLIQERVRWVSSQVGISPVAARRYLDDEAVEGLAETMAFSLVEETPGADLLDAPRTVGVPLALIGRCVAGLAEAVQVRLCEVDDVGHIRVTVAQLAHALSAIGQLTAAVPGSGRPGQAAGPVVVMLPPGLVHRAARYLDAVATLVGAGVLPEGVPSVEADQLAATFRQDASNLRACATA